MTVPTYELGTIARLEGVWSGPLPEVLLKVRGPGSATATTYKLSVPADDIVDDGGGEYHKNLVVAEAGPWYYIFSDGDGERTIEGSFLVDPNQALAPGVTDLRDVRTLIPRVRRALDGPAATSPLADATTLSDDEVTALIADAIADILLYTGGAAVFGHMLEVVARDPFYMAPIAWRTDTQMSLPEESVVVAQGAMNFFFHSLQSLKVEETIQNERQQWTVRLSVQLISKQFDMLKDARDNALATVKATHAVPESYVSFLGERDAWVANWVEPWLDPGTMNWETSEPPGWAIQPGTDRMPGAFPYPGG